MRKALSLVLAVIMLLSVAIVAVGAADTDAADVADGTLTVIAKDFKGGTTVSQTYNVGDTFTIWTSLNAKDINSGKMGSLKGEQLYDNAYLTLADKYESDGMISDLNAMFPITKQTTVANGKKIGGIYYNASTPSTSGFSSPFNSDESYMIIAHYKVTAAGETTIENNLVTLAIADFYLTRVVDRGVIKNDDFTSACTLSEGVPPTGATLSGNVKSFVTTETEGNYPTTIELLRGDTIVQTASYDTAANFDYSFTDVEEGVYTLRISKKNHVTREYDVTVSGNTTQDAEIHPIGDINGDGKVNNFDYGRVNSHSRSKSTLTGYEFLCGDINGDGKINNLDAGRVNSMARNKSSLWT